MEESRPYQEHLSVNKRKSNAATATRRPRSTRGSSQRMRTTAFDELNQKDFLTALTMWLVVEVMSFLILPPMIGGPSAERLQSMLWPSVIFGVGGAWLVGNASRFIAITHEQRHGVNQRSVMSILAQAVSWFAVAGILYPLIIVAGEFFSRFGG
jgi:hypothetical protein